MEYELVVWLQRIEQKQNLILKKLRPDLFKEAKEEKNP